MIHPFAENYGALFFGQSVTVGIAETMPAIMDIFRVIFMDIMGFHLDVFGQSQPGSS